jgi:hypothetical protein
MSFGIFNVVESRKQETLANQKASKQKTRAPAAAPEEKGKERRGDTTPNPPAGPTSPPQPHRAGPSPSSGPARQRARGAAGGGAGSRTLAESNAVWGEVFDVRKDGGGHAHTRTRRVALAGFSTAFRPLSLSL